MTCKISKSCMVYSKVKPIMKIFLLILFVAPSIFLGRLTFGRQEEGGETVSKAEVASIISAYYVEIKNGNKKRDIEVKKCSQKEINFYKSDPFYSKNLGVFSACDYTLYDRTQTNCSSVRLIIKKCDTNASCNYFFSEMDLGTCS